MALVMNQQPAQGYKLDVPIDLDSPGGINIDQVDQDDKKVELPPGFPQYMHSKLAWSGSQLESHQYIYHLTEDDKLEIDTALVSFKGAKSCFLYSFKFLLQFSVINSSPTI